MLWVDGEGMESPRLALLEDLDGPGRDESSPGLGWDGAHRIAEAQRGRLDAGCPGVGRTGNGVRLPLALEE
jgi:hypothetical protein